MSNAPQSLPLNVALKQAAAHHQAGRLHEAEQLYRAVLQAQPYHADANHNLGVLAGQLGQHAVGLPYLKTALAVNPTQAQYLLSYAEALLANGQTREALDILQNAMQRGLNTAAVQVLRQKAEVTALSAPAKGEEPTPVEMSQVVALFNAGRYVELESQARVLVDQYPSSGFAWKALGTSLQLQGKGALHALQMARKLSPDDAEAHSNLGNALRDLGQLDDAVASYRRALEIKPNFVEAHSNLGNALRDLGQLDAAVASYRRALEISPDSAEVHNNFGNALQALGQFDDAVASYRLALGIKPDYADAYSNLGAALRILGQPNDAVASCRRAVEIKPDFAEAHNNLGNALQALGQLDDAVASYRQALEIKPDYADAHSNLIFALDLAVEGNIATLQQERSRWDSIHAAPLVAAHRPHSNQPDPERRLRIGYVSADFRVHSAASVFGAMLLKFDPTCFEVFAYSNSTIEDSHTRLFQQGVTCWRTIVGRTDEAVADLIRQDEMDILVDLSGHSAGNRLLVFARKPAPIQVTAWGYATSTGMRAMDVFFADPVVVPPDERQFFTEDVRYLPNVVGSFFPQAFPVVNALPALSANRITFGSFNRLAKVSEEAFNVWVRVLLAIPRSRLVLKTGELDDRATRDGIVSYFSGAGIVPERIVLLGKTPWHEHVAAFNQIDIALDPFPHGGGVTTLEGLMMGVPVVTLRWPTVPGRLSASILTTLGLTDWIAETPEQYVEIARQKAQNLTALTDLRQQLRPVFTSSIIGDSDAYVRSVEQEYRKLWREWCATPGGKL